MSDDTTGKPGRKPGTARYTATTNLRLEPAELEMLEKLAELWSEPGRRCKLAEAARKCIHIAAQVTLPASQS